MLDFINFDIYYDNIIKLGENKLYNLLCRVLIKKRKSLKIICFVSKSKKINLSDEAQVVIITLGQINDSWTNTRGWRYFLKQKLFSNKVNVVVSV